MSKKKGISQSYLVFGCLFAKNIWTIALPKVLSIVMNNTECVDDFLVDIVVVFNPLNLELFCFLLGYLV